MYLRRFGSRQKLQNHYIVIFLGGLVSSRIVCLRFLVSFISSNTIFACVSFHTYKIRKKEKEYGTNHFLGLFLLLNLPIRSQYRINMVTQIVGTVCFSEKLSHWFFDIRSCMQTARGDRGDEKYFFRSCRSANEDHKRRVKFMSA